MDSNYKKISVIKINQKFIIKNVYFTVLFAKENLILSTR